MKILTAISLLILLVAIGCGREVTSEQNSATQTADTSETTDVKATPVVFKEITLEVPSMHCPYACPTTIEKTLAGIEGVEGVEFVNKEAQQEAGTVTDPRFVVKYTGDFDPAAAAKLLADADYPNAKVAATN